MAATTMMHGSAESSQTTSLGQVSHSSEGCSGHVAACPRISIIVPAYNNLQDLRECLTALISSAGADSEIIVVDDASTDDTPTGAARMGVRVLCMATNSGPAAARNYGASQAQGDILFFVDADVVIGAEAIHRIRQLLTEDPDLAAVFGSYDAHPRAKGVVSRYRNLLHHFVHQQGNAEASTFWAGCGAIRKAVFEAVGGFDSTRYRKPSIEDIELGYRLRQAGYRILLDKTLQGTHLKRWTLWSVIRTDVRDRAIPWARLILERKSAINDLNLKGEQRLCAGLVGVASILLPLAVLHLELFALPTLALLTVTILNRKLYRFFAQQRGISFAAACMALHFLYYLYSGLSYLFVLVDWHLRKRLPSQMGSRLRS
jgi:cellulose synthase/poly-beta-1,6-N-acetylglucosamine synthase-like glycosyltransferase